jgi:hypothetical protein
MEFADFDGDGLGDLILLIQGRNSVTNVVDRFGFFVPSRAVNWITLIGELLVGTTDFFDFLLNIPSTVLSRTSYFQIERDGGSPRLVLVQENGGRSSFVGSSTGLRQDFAPRGFDFDGDGLEDLAITSRHTDDVTGDTPGRINVAFGGSSVTLVAVPLVDLFGDADGVLPSVGYGDFDGSCRPGSTATCDDELLIGSPGLAAGGVFSAGSLAYVKYDGPERVLNRTNLPAAPDEGGLGFRLATGDFNGDGFDDAAVSAFDFGDPSSVLILSGGPDELTTGSSSHVFDAADFALPTDGTPAFAREIEAGDFNCDGFEDLAIGAPNVTVNGQQRAGAVIVLRGSGTGLSASGFQRLDKTTSGLPGAPADTQSFGTALAAGNFNADSTGENPCVDLAISAGLDATRRAVYVLKGSGSGLSTAASQRLVRGEIGISGPPEAGDQFGFDLAITRANTDEFDDLIIGSHGVEGVHVLLGGSAGIATSGHGMFKRGVFPVPFGLLPDEQGADAVFGAAVGGTSDGVVAVGAPQRSLVSFFADGLIDSAGMATVIQFAETQSLLIDKFTEVDGDFHDTIGQFSQEFFVLKPADQGWSEFVTGDYWDEATPFDKLAFAGLFSHGLSRPRAGSRNAPARRRSNFGMNMHLSQFEESGEFARPTPGLETVGACVHAAGKLELRDRGQVTSRNLLAQTLQVGNDARVNGNVFVGGSGVLGHRSIIAGNAALEGLLELGSNSSVTGTLRQQSIVAPLVIARQTVSPGTASVTVPNDAVQAVAPGSYGDVLVQARATAQLRAGTYQLASLRLEDAVLMVDTSMGDVQIKVAGTIELGDRARVLVAGPQRVSFYSIGTATVRVGNDVQAFASFTAPHGRVLVSSRAAVTGCVAASEIFVEPDGRVLTP